MNEMKYYNVVCEAVRSGECVSGEARHLRFPAASSRFFFSVGGWNIHHIPTALRSSFFAELKCWCNFQRSHQILGFQKIGGEKRPCEPKCI